MDLKVKFVCVGMYLLFYLRTIISEKDQTLRFKDRSFLTPDSPEVFIYGKKISCIEEIVPGKFPAHTWTCRDMRVNGSRMAYGYNPSIIKDHKCTETKGFDELGEVCRTLMHEIGALTKLWVAFVTNATCDFINEERVMLNMTSNRQYQWDSMPAGYGWIDTLQCMEVKKNL